MRLFTAIDLPDDVRGQLADLQAPTSLDARWTDPSQFHVTLRFIGDASLNQAARYEEALGGIKAPPVDCVPYGLDVLPSRRNPSVLIVGLERTEDLLTLYEAVSRALEEQGLGPEDRTYRPHVTLARLNDASAETVNDFLKRQDVSSLAAFHVDTFHLYESTLTQDGAVHERRATFDLES